MDLDSYLQAFEVSVQSYVGDDPLDPWDKFVQFLDGKLSLEEGKGMSVVLERLVQTFLQDERYHNDPRYVAHCIRCDPEVPSPAPKMVRIISRSENNPVRTGGGNSMECVSMYCVNELQCEGSELSFEELRAKRYFAKRIQREEQRQLAEKQHRLWEEEEEVRKLQQLLDDLEKNVTLQPAERRNPAAASLTGVALHQVKAPEPVWSSRPQTGLQLQTGLVAGHDGTRENSVAETSHPLTAPLPSAACESLLGQTDRAPESTAATSHSTSLIQSDNTEPEACARGDVDVTADSEYVSCTHWPQSCCICPHSRSASCSGFNHSRVTPNTSLGFAHATPSRAIPSPTVNTREALGVIMDMFQAPTLLQESMFNSTVLPEDSFERSCRIKRYKPVQEPQREGDAAGALLDRLHPAHGGAAASGQDHTRRRQARQPPIGREVPGERLLPAGSPGARPGSDCSGAEHRHDALPRRHCVHCQVHDFRLPVCGDAERPTLDLSGIHNIGFLDTTNCAV